MKLIKKTVKIVGIFVLMVIVSGASFMFIAARRSIIPDNLNMSSSGDMTGMEMNSTQIPTMNMGSLSVSATPMTLLVTPPTDAPVKSFTLTAQTAKINLGNGKIEDAYTYNGTIPGPELRVQQ